MLEWLDSTGSPRTWVGDEDGYCDMRCYTLGFLIAETRDYVLVAGHHSGSTKSHSGGLQIPKRAIVWRRNVKV